jgi:glycosyltransferase involved in cell wall biosynthesis
MRVLHAIASLDPASGGPARSVPQLLIALKEEGLDVALWVASRVLPDWSRALTDKGIPVICREFPDLKGVSLIHDHGVWLPSNHCVATWARDAGIPRIVSPRGMLEPWAMAHRKWKKRLAWCLYQKRDLLDAAALHATAESEASQFRKLGLKMPVIVSPNGVEIPEGRGGDKGDSGVRIRNEGFKGEGDSGKESKSEFRTALFLGRIHPKKGLPMLVEAWAKVRPSGWRMRVAGPDEEGHMAEISAMIHEAGLDEVWSLEGEVSDEAKWKVFGEADLFILPTHSENFGISVAEALASGLPVITTTGAPWRGVVEHQCGWWVEPSVDDLARALQVATSNQSPSLKLMGERGREWVARDFSWKGIAQSMLKGYNNLIINQSHERRP